MNSAKDLNKFFDKAFKNIEKQVEFATKLALTWTAKEGQKAGEKRIKQALHMPISRTQKSFFIQAATKQTLTAKVFLKDYYAKGTAPSSYLTILTGGPRPSKRSEGALRSRGLLGKGQYIVPNGIKLNKNGNVTGSMMTKILSGIKGHRDRLQDSKVSPYFVVNDSVPSLGKSELPNGIYRKMARGVKLLFNIVDHAPRIRKRFDFDKLMAKTAKKQLNKQMVKALRFAKKTAR